MQLLLLELLHERIAQVGPDLAEGPLAHVSEGPVPPELVGVNLPVPTHAPDPLARAVPLVHPQEFQHLPGPVGVLFQKAQVQIDPVGVVVHRENFLGFAAIVQVLCPDDDEVHDPPRLLVREVLGDQLAPAARVNKVVEANPGNVLSLDQVEYPVNIRGVALVDGETQPDLDPRLAAIPNPRERFVEGPAVAPEPVVRLAQPIEAHSHVGQIRFLELARAFPRDQGAVRRDHRAQPRRRGVPRQFEKVRPHQRFAA